MTKTNFFETKEAVDLLKKLEKRYHFWKDLFEKWRCIENTRYPLGFIGKKKKLNSLVYTPETIQKNLECARSLFFLFYMCNEATQEGKRHIILSYNIDLPSRDFVYGNCHIEDRDLITRVRIPIAHVIAFCYQHSLSLDFDCEDDNPFIKLSF